jgi:hypothetical protein
MNSSTLRVKLSIPGAGTNVDLSQFTGNQNNIIDGCQFFVNSPILEADVWLVVDDVIAQDSVCQVPIGATGFLTSEVALPDGYFTNFKSRSLFLQQFEFIRSCHDVFQTNAEPDLPFLPWMLNSNHGPTMYGSTNRDLKFLEQLKPLDKKKKISMICSDVTYTENHKMRLEFARKLKDELGDSIDWFGNGIQALPEKWEGLAPYEFSVVLENKASPWVVTEKIFDSLLVYTVPIYWGAPNINKFVSSKAMVQIDLKDYSKTVEKIKSLVDGDFYNQYLEHIPAVREEILGKFHFLRRMAALAHLMNVKNKSEPKEVIKLRSMDSFKFETGHGKLLSAGIVGGETLEKIGRRIKRKMEK